MKLTKFSDYSLRILMYLAVLPESQKATISELADVYAISINHVRVVVHNLGKLGYITSTQGKGGGIKLAMKPQDISVGEVIRNTESDFQLVDCMNPESSCSISNICKLQHLLHSGLELFLEHLDHYTLADITENKKTLLKRFSMNQ